MKRYVARRRILQIAELDLGRMNAVEMVWDMLQDEAMEDDSHVGGLWINMLSQSFP